jgi:hypothetical protein
MNPTIQQARELLRPTPVQVRSMPEWFAQRLRAAYGHSDPQKALDSLTDRFAARREHLFDHAGTSIIPSRFVDPECYVAEPYGIDSATCILISRLCGDLGCYYEIDANSWHYPGRSIRVVFHQGYPR